MFFHCIVTYKLTVLQFDGLCTSTREVHGNLIATLCNDVLLAGQKHVAALILLNSKLYIFDKWISLKGGNYVLLNVLVN